MKNNFLKFCFLTGAVVDAFAMIPMLFPKTASLMFGIPDFSPAADYRYAIYLGSSLMLGWTCLLVWASRKPQERRGVLILTVLVVCGLGLAGGYAVKTGFVFLEKMIPVWGIQIALIILYLYAYLFKAKA